MASPPTVINWFAPVKASILSTACCVRSWSTRPPRSFKVKTVSTSVRITVEFAKVSSAASFISCAVPRTTVRLAQGGWAS
jgi:hypothetical protein